MILFKVWLESAPPSLQDLSAPAHVRYLDPPLFPSSSSAQLADININKLMYNMFIDICFIFIKYL